MKKTYVTTMPDHIGAFLKASECFASLNINITRVSYNKAVDSNTLFIDAEGSEQQLSKADALLNEIGYLDNNRNSRNIVLLEFSLRDIPGGATAILSLIREFSFNISYISSQENGSDYQLFKMGLFVEDAGKITEFLSQAEKICKVRVIDYDHTEKIYDNSIFYNSFVNGLAESIDITEEKRNSLLVNTNLAMQTLDEKGLSPYRTFESIGKFAELLSLYRGNAFSPRINRYKYSENTEITLIEPPCGSNTAVIRSTDGLLFVDSGYACYKEEMLSLFKKLFPDYDTVKKSLLLTHADVDHTGLLPIFDEILLSRKSAECLKLEYEEKHGFREQNPIHRPYINICKILTSYSPVSPEKLHPMWGCRGDSEEPLVQTGFFNFGELHFEVYEGKGGHLPGENVFIDYTHRIAFTGDIYVNVKDMTPEQAKYNQYAPILMTSVDTDPKLCAAERSSIMQRLGNGDWHVYGAHGAKKDLSIKIL
ncbi:MAG: Zn-dependent hydrolase [Ruminococcaceae bacterium]|nr:Zn-dependent hydrolase [Oscillospiraceae bacterium]